MKATEEEKARMRKYYQKNKEYLKAKQREYYRQHKNDPEFIRRRKEYRKIYSKTHREEKKQYEKRWRDSLKLETLTHYSNGTIKCARCGFNTDIRALTLDHIKGEGNEHRRKTGRRGHNFYNLLKQKGFPNGYQVLCMNCQLIKKAENREL